MTAAVYPLGLGEPDAEALAFPREILDGVESALILFASGRGGATDGRWFAEAGISQVDFLDWDADTLTPMTMRAPKGWLGQVFDCTVLPEGAFKSDHVSADPPSQLAPEIVGFIPGWLACARKSATITLYRHCFIGEPTLDAPELANPPEGWTYTNLIRRSDFRGGIYWLVAEHA